MKDGRPAVAAGGCVRTIGGMTAPRPAHPFAAALLAACPAAFAHPPGADGVHGAETVDLAGLDRPIGTPDSETYRPSAVPDRIVLTYQHDPATTTSVTWRTGEEVETAIAQLTPALGGPSFVAKEDRMEADPGVVTTLRATTENYTTELSAAKYHTVEFAGLTPTTRYSYRVGDGTNWSEWADFTTAADSAEPFTFIYVGDAQNEVKSLWSRLIRQAYGDAPEAAFTLHAGDLIDRAEADGEWGGWFYAGGFINRSTPVLATPGNHEYLQSPRKLSSHWGPTFAFPTNGPDLPGMEETVWSLDYQGVRFISLNSNERQAEQVDWLRGALKDNPNGWTVVTFHHPMYNSTLGRDNPELRELWQPVFDEYGVDLVLQGHDHTYARSKLVTLADNVIEGNVSRGTREDVKPQPPASVPETNVAFGVTGVSDAGTVYVVSVSGPKQYDLGDRPLFRRTGTGVQLYQVITIDGDTLTYESRNAIGEKIDGFTLTHNPTGPNTLTEDKADPGAPPAEAR